MKNQPSAITQDALIGSLERLIKKKSFENISVSELTKVAGISRMTFYRHYHNSIDILNLGVQELLNKFNQTIKYSGDNYAYILKVVTFFQQHSKFIKLLLNTNQQDLLYQNASIIIGELAHMNNYLNGLNDQEKHYYIEYHTTGLMSVIIDWIKNDQVESPTKLAKFIDYNSR